MAIRSSQVTALLLGIFILTASATALAQDRPSASVRIRTLLGWEIHRDIDYSHLTSQKVSELFGPSENERHVSALGALVGPEISLRRGRLFLRGSVLMGTHGLPSDARSTAHYVGADVGYGRVLAGIVGYRKLRVEYGDLDSTRLADYDLSDVVIGLHGDIARPRSRIGLTFTAAMGISAIPRLFDEARLLETPQLFEVDLNMTYSVPWAPVRFAIGYSFMSHQKPVRTYRPASTLIFDKVWEVYYPIWHGINLATSYSF